MFIGVSKSGSPTPRDIASGMSFTTSKNFPIPEGSRFLICCDTYSFMAKC